MDDDIPDLEDFSDQLKNKQPINNKATLKVNVINDDKSKVKEEPKLSNTVKVENKEPEFGSGFKRGFLKKSVNSNSNSNNVKQNNSNKEIVDLTHIKAKEQNEIKEVQEKMKELKNVNSNAPNVKLLNDMVKEGNKDKWMNNDLMTRLMKNPKLMKYFMHPDFSSILQLMQTNPALCKEKFGNNPEFNDFFKEFSSIMADHFSDLGVKSMSPDPEVQKILSDPKVMEVMQIIQKEGKLDMDNLKCEESVKKKILMLIDKGFLKMNKY